MSTSKEVIVVAEDSPANRNILCHLLKKLDFEVVECQDGQEALDKINEAIAQQKTVHALISDIMMPRLDGIKLAQALRKEEVTKNLPIVFVTAVADKGYLFEAKSLNVQGYIMKPVTVQRVQKKLAELFPAKVFPKLAV